MIIQANLASLKETRPHQYAQRFFFGGLATVIAGLIAQHYGPSIGGLFLAFPAIFPASATLIANHEKRKKREAGYDGTRRGRTAAAIDAAGAALGALGLAAFALILWKFLPTASPWLVLPTAALVWLTLSTALWFARKNIHLPATKSSVR
jgi:Protein of unknown function (DUF3147)